MKLKLLWLSLSIMLLVSLAKTGLGQDIRVCACKFDDSEPKRVWVLFKNSKEGYKPAQKGMLIYKHTLLKAEAPASAVLFCDADGGIKRETLDGSDPAPTVPCSSSPNKPLIIAGRLVDIPRRMTIPDEGFPRILTPRHTALLDARPQLSWTSVRGVSSYEVSIEKETSGGVVWSGRVPAKSGAREQTLEFPADVTLQENVDYRVVVRAGGRSSQEDEDTELAFRLLSDRQKVIEEANKIRKLPTDELTKAFLVASFYNALDLKYDALQTLKQLPKTEGDPESVRLTAGLYLATGLVRRAEFQFLRLVRSPLKELDSNEGQVLANTALGNIYDYLGNEAKSQRYFNVVNDLTGKPASMPQNQRRDASISPAKPPGHF